MVTLTLALPKQILRQGFVCNRFMREVLPGETGKGWGTQDWKGEEAKQGCNFRPTPTGGNPSLLPPRTDGVKSTPRGCSNLRQGGWALQSPPLDRLRLKTNMGWDLNSQALGIKQPQSSEGRLMSESHRCRPLGAKVYKIEEETCRNGKGNPRESGGTPHWAESTFLWSKKRHYLGKNSLNNYT